MSAPKKGYSDMSKEEWDKLLRFAGFKHDHKHHKNHHVRDHDHRDHLYSLIEPPGRHRNSSQIFGMAKAFPETTRTGYRHYLQHKLAEDAEKNHKFPDDSNEEDEHPEAHEGGADHHDEPEHDSAHEDAHHEDHVEGHDLEDYDEEIYEQHHPYESAEHIHGYQLRNKAFTLRDFSPYYRFRAAYHAEMAEFLGTLVFLAIGFAASCQSLTSQGSKSTYDTTVLTWGFGQMAGIYVAGGYSGAHLNPVVTFNLWFFRGFPFRRMFTFWLAQFMGALLAAAWIFILYYPALKKLDPNGWSLSTGGSFYTIPLSDIPVASAWFNEVSATALIHTIVFAVGDRSNISPARGMNALVIGFSVTAMGSSFGYLSPFGMNPVRDFAPRIFLSMVGFPKQLWTFKDWWWVTGGITGPLLGGVLGAFAYDFFIFDGPESPINFPKGVKRRAMKAWFDDVILRTGRHERRLRREMKARKRGLEQDQRRGTVQVQGQPAR
nr:IC01 [Starmerella bombicola]